jgi:hypothetical protein
MKNLIQKSVIIFITLILISCSSEKELTKEQILQQSIAEIESRFEERSLSKIVEYVSESYKDETDRNLKDIKRAIQIQLMRHKSLYVFSVVKNIEWTGDKLATVEIAAAMGGKPIESASILTSVRADMVKFTVDFALEDEVYKVQSAIWRRADPSDFIL